MSQELYESLLSGNAEIQIWVRATQKSSSRGNGCTQKSVLSFRFPSFPSLLCSFICES